MSITHREITVVTLRHEHEPDYRIEIHMMFGGATEVWTTDTVYDSYTDAYWSAGDIADSLLPVKGVAYSVMVTCGTTPVASYGVRYVE